MYRRRRRSASGRSYSIAHLLEKQPKWLQKHQSYRTMLAYYRASDRLKRLRISSRCYTLLNQARIEPRNLASFYRTYRLPADPFFPLFFTIKRAYFSDRQRRLEERHRYIVDKMRGLQPEILTQVKYLGFLERYYNAAGRSPVWQARLFPSSKKQADTFSRFTESEWHGLFRDHLLHLMSTYPALKASVAERVLACFRLGILPEGTPPAMPSTALITRTYRRLSLLHHPDRGGDPELFVAIKRARDVLVSRR